MGEVMGSYVPRITLEQTDTVAQLLTKLRERTGHTYRTIASAIGMSYNRFYSLSNEYPNGFLPNGKEIIALLDFFTEHTTFSASTLERAFIRSMRNTIKHSTMTKIVKLKTKKKK